MVHTCSCGWKFLGDSNEEELIARIEHLREEHFDSPDREFDETNLELLTVAHDALHLIDTDELGAWYNSQIGRMRNDACEIMGWETDDHPRTSVAINHGRGD